MSQSALSQFESPVVRDRWCLIKKVGKGTFCELFLARNILPHEESGAPDFGQVAIKLQAEDADKSSIRTEAEILKALSGLRTVPRFIKAGKHENREYVVMELLSGEDMAHMRDRIRNSSAVRIIPLPGAIFLAKKMLGAIQAIHSRGYIHRDIKPANFIRRSHDSTDFVMIDFGITKLYKDNNGEVRKERQNCEFRGTAQYASPYAHQGVDQCPRDDLLSLALVFCDLICGKLPWLEMVKNKDKHGTASQKMSFCENPEKLTQWVLDMTEAELAKCETESDRYSNFPERARRNCEKIFSYLMKLRYEDSTPDYDFIHSLFDEMVSQRVHDEHNVGDITYKHRGFSWSGGIDKRMKDREPITTDPILLQDLAHCRMKYLHRFLSTVRKDQDPRVGGSSAKAGSSDGKRKHASSVADESENDLSVPGASSTLSIGRSSITPVKTDSDTFATPKKGNWKSLFPELQVYSPSEFTMMIWNSVISDLEIASQFSSLQKEKMNSIRRIAEKYAFFTSQFATFGKETKKPRLTQDILADGEIAEEGFCAIDESGNKWKHTDHIFLLNRRFFRIEEDLKKGKVQV